jgi:DNA-binding SARP family transcriptional activator
MACFAEAQHASDRAYPALDGLRLHIDDTPVLDHPRLHVLLAYLVLHRHAPQARQHLAFLLWPNSTETQARTNLRGLLHRLRQALPDIDRFLSLDAQTVQWHSDVLCSVDVAAFERELTLADQAQHNKDLAADPGDRAFAVPG